MAHYSVFAEDHEIRGATIIPYRDSLNIQMYTDIFDKHGFTEIDPEKWYPMHKLVAVFNDISNADNAMMNFVSIGTSMAENLPLPPEMANLKFVEMIQSVEQAYAFSNRGENYGYMKGVIISDNHVTVHYRCPYPDDLLYGSLHGYAKRFLPKGTRYTVKYDDQTKRMDQGGHETVIHVTWE